MHLHIQCLRLVPEKYTKSNETPLDCMIAKASDTRALWHSLGVLS